LEVDYIVNSFKIEKHLTLGEISSLWSIIWW